MRDINIKRIWGGNSLILSFIAIILLLSVIGILLGSNTKYAENAPAESASSKTKASLNAAVASKDSGSATTTGSSPTDPCVNVLTATEAQSLIGSQASPSVNNGVVSKSVDITEVNCSYSFKGTSVSILDYMPNSSIGQSDNDVRFGSGLPSGVTQVNGYGNSAFWQASSGLNILQNNNWYVVNYANNGASSLSASEKLAKTANL